MPQLIIGNKIITEPIINILHQIRKELKTDKLKQITVKGDNIAVSCPVHKSGRELHPSCQIYIGDELTEYGTFNCFSCKSKGNFCQFVNACFDETGDFGEQWLLERYGNVFVDKDLLLPSIDLTNKSTISIQESTLNDYAYYHPYMFERKLTKDVIDKFKVGFDKQTESIVFPYWDMHNNLIGVTKRSVKTKYFYIDPSITKGENLYLLNDIIKNNITQCGICESQIDALTAYEYGMPTVATLGGITLNQIKLLNKSGVRVLYTLFDNDEYGRKFTQMLNKHISKDIIVINVTIPDGFKDVNDLDKEHFWQAIDLAKNITF